ncbi:MAG TPA: vWA domain-containing protein [Phycisphaerae bacterium]|nr:vWA domain-containing protein [Phycisphaerae bacterium]
MHLRRRKGQSKLRRASVMVQSLIFGSTVGLGVAALAVDTGLMFSAKQELQNAADAAALAAASQLGVSTDPAGAAAQEAAIYAAKNKVAGGGSGLDIQTGIIFGHAVLDGEKYDFRPSEAPYDSVQITLKRDATASDGPVSLLFAKTFGMDGASLHASATAMVVPRDIAVVIDCSGSMNDDSELRHYKEFQSESGGTRPGVQINLKECWQLLESPSPSWGQMTNWGNDIILGSYAPVGDPGLWKIQKNSSCTEDAVATELAARGYSSTEVNCLKSGSGDNSYYRNRVRVILGLADWKSGKTGGKYPSGGNGDNYVQDSELTNKVAFPYPTGTSSATWNDYVDYVSGSSEMTSTDANFRYRFGIKTFVNFLLENRGAHSQTPNLAQVPEQPLQSVKDAVQAMIDVIIDLETQDHVSLEVFAQYGSHAHDLTVPPSPEQLAAELLEIPATLNGYQAGHITSVTNIGAGFEKARIELSSERARTSAAKVVMLLTDGKPNVNSSDVYVGDNNPQAISWAEDRAQSLTDMGATIYTIGVGGDVNADLCQDLAGDPDRYFFADNTPDPEHGGQPMYVTQLQQIFQTLGGKRPVRLIR